MIRGAMYQIILLLFVCQGLGAQAYIGIKAGYAIPFSRSEEIKYDDAQDFLTYKMRFVEQDVSPGVSIFTYYRNEMVYLQAEIGYRVVKTRFSSVDFLNLINQVPTETIKKTGYMRIPLSAGIWFDRFHFGAGPVFSVILNENDIFSDIEHFEERRKGMDAGFQFSFGITVYRLQWDISYEYQFNSVADYLYYRDDNKAFKNQAQFINLGMSFLF